MNREELAEELDREIEDRVHVQSVERNGSLLQIAAELRLLPSEEFRYALRADLVEHADVMQIAHAETTTATEQFPLGTPEYAPTLTERQYGVLPADPRSLLLSFTSHAAVVALIVSGIWVGHQTVIRSYVLESELTLAPLPPGSIAPHGGGGSGDRSTVQASRGTPPKFSEEQLTPPALIVRIDRPKLPADPTVLGPPELKLPQSNRLGDLVSSNVVTPSNGTGSDGGMGDNYGTGLGRGKGPGVGPGMGGGFGDGPFRVGNGVSSPRAIYNPDPEYSDEARKAKFQGNVVLSLIVDPLGHVRDIHVARSLGMGLDEKALEAVRRWRFEPGMKDGYPVAVQVNVEVNFRLY
jgi:periplasmic protein TonB